MKPGTKSIYCWKDPRTNEVRYVGASNLVKTEMRLHGQFLLAWHEELLKEGYIPSFEILELDVVDWTAAERKWVLHFKGLGARLLNSMLLKPLSSQVPNARSWTPAMKARLKASRAKSIQNWTPERRAAQAELTRKSWKARRPECPSTTPTK